MELEAIRYYQIAQEAIAKLKEAYELIDTLQANDPTGLIQQYNRLVDYTNRLQFEAHSVLQLLFDPDFLSQHYPRLEFELGQLPEIQQFKEQNPGATFEQYRAYRTANMTPQPQIPIPSGGQGSSYTGLPPWLAIRQMDAQTLFSDI